MGNKYTCIVVFKAILAFFYHYEHRVYRFIVIDELRLLERCYSLHRPCSKIFILKLLHKNKPIYPYLCQVFNYWSEMLQSKFLIDFSTQILTPHFCTFVWSNNILESNCFVLLPVVSPAGVGTPVDSVCLPTLSLPCSSIL